MGVKVDSELLAAWRDGERDAGEELIARHFDSICRFFRRKLGDDVQDHIQQTFLDCVEGHNRIEGEFRGYLFGIARNRLAMHLRTRSRAAPQTDFSVQSIADFGTTPSQTIARSQDQELLLAHMQQIPVDQQILLELVYWEGLSGPEVARALDIEVNTVRSRLSRSRANLRTRLERTHDHAQGLIDREFGVE